MHPWMIKMHNHSKVDYTKLPPLDDLQACSESSCTKHPISNDFASILKIIQKWINKTSDFGRCIIIQKWIIQKFCLWMISKHAHNHPKVDYTKVPSLDDLQACSESIKSGLYKTSNLGWLASILRIIQKWINKMSNFGRCIIIQKWIIQTSKTYNFGWLASMLRIIQKWIVQNIQVRMT